ncbi:LysR family transcriptional regulator [Pararhodobacter oceanensis]|uniref:LysR family transcriptional regulator n=1 Tax=Pararhodobacter oceanensis TaxID=2172121 RepID=UPI003A8F6CE5
MNDAQRDYDIARLRTFIAIAKTGDLQAAAEQLKTSHAQVSVRLRSLEDHLGVELFKRTPSGMILTAAGAALLPEARAILAESTPTPFASDMIRGVKVNGRFALPIPSSGHRSGATNRTARIGQRFSRISAG